MKLYLVRDGDDQLYVVAESFEKCLERWRYARGVQLELEPDGIEFIAGDEDIVYPEGSHECWKSCFRLDAANSTVSSLAEALNEERRKAPAGATATDARDTAIDG